MSPSVLACNMQEFHDICKILSDARERIANLATLTLVCIAFDSKGGLIALIDDAPKKKKTKKQQPFPVALVGRRKTMTILLLCFKRRINDNCKMISLVVFAHILAIMVPRSTTFWHPCPFR